MVDVFRPFHLFVSSHFSLPFILPLPRLAVASQIQLKDLGSAVSSRPSGGERHWQPLCIHVPWL